MKKFTKLLSVLLTFALVLSVGMADAYAAFDDIPADADYAEAVDWCVEQGLMVGTGDSEFSPDATLTRAMVATVLYRAAGEPTVSGTPAFDDTEADTWYSNAVIWANQNGIVMGYGDGLFGTEDPITVEQLDILIRRYNGEDPAWTGDQALAVPATRAQAAAAFYAGLNTGTSAPETPGQETHTNAFNLDTHTVRLNNGIEMPILGIGTFTLTNEQASDSVFWALSDGYHLIDTAAAYNNEEGVGEGIRRAIESGVVEREDIFLTTKLWPSAYNMEGIDAALERLGVDYIDLLLLHQPIGDYISGYQAMEQAVAEGKVRAIGLSNFRPDQFAEIMEIATITPAVNQVETHPYYQEVEMMEYLDQFGTVLEAWYPLGGRGNTQTMFADETISAIAETHGKSSAQIILRWHLQAGHIAIPGSNNPDHILENISIFDFELTDEEMAAMTAIDRNDPFFGGFGNQDELEDAADRWGLDNN